MLYCLCGQERCRSVGRESLGTVLFCTTEDPRYNDSVCYQRFCCKIEFAVIKKLDVDPSKA